MQSREIRAGVSLRESAHDAGDRDRAVLFAKASRSEIDGMLAAAVRRHSAMQSAVTVRRHHEFMMAGGARAIIIVRRYLVGRVPAGLRRSMIIRSFDRARRTAATLA
jgi:hypothetical protein